MWIKILITFITIILFSNSLYSDAANGKLLYEKAKCAQCHSSDIFTHEDRKMKSYKKLKKQVAWCAFQHNAVWFESETMDVVDYLNHNYYHFKESDDQKKE